MTSQPQTCIKYRQTSNSLVTTIHYRQTNNICQYCTYYKYVLPLSAVVIRHTVTNIIQSSAKIVSYLHSVAHYQLVLPSYQLATCGLRAFSVAGPKLWNSLPRLLRETAHSTASFAHTLKMLLLPQYYCIVHIRGFGDDALHKFTFYLLTDNLQLILAIYIEEVFSVRH